MVLWFFTSTSNSKLLDESGFYEKFIHNDIILNKKKENSQFSQPFPELLKSCSISGDHNYFYNFSYGLNSKQCRKYSGSLVYIFDNYEDIKYSLTIHILDVC